MRKSGSGKTRRPANGDELRFRAASVVGRGCAIDVPTPPRRRYASSMDRAHLIVELDQEVDGRWIAEVAALPGVLACGSSREETLARVQALALRVLADRLEHGEAEPELGQLFDAA